MLSWACTVHKVQGLGLNQIVVSFDLLRQQSFNHGQMYVTLSCVTSLHGLYLTGKFNSKAISVDQKAKNEYEFLRENQSVSFSNLIFNNFNDNLLTLSICNVRSLRKHVKDLQSDKAFMSSDLILCTESQLLDGDSVGEIFIDNLELTCNNSPHKFSSLAIYYKSNLEVEHNFRLDGFYVLEVKSDMLSSLLRLRILLLYRKNSSPILQFLETLKIIFR